MKKRRAYAKRPQRRLGPAVDAHGNVTVRVPGDPPERQTYEIVSLERQTLKAMARELGAVTGRQRRKMRKQLRREQREEAR